MFMQNKQAPRTSRANLVKGTRSAANAMGQQTLIAHWQSIVKSLTSYMKSLKANYVCFRVTWHIEISRFDI